MPLAGLAQHPASQPSEARLELARSLYYEGLSLADQQRWAEATAHFERVLAIRDSIVVSYQIAVAYSHVGRYLDARHQLRRVLADAEATPQMREAANTLLSQVEASIGSLALRLRGDSEGVRIQVNGREVPLVALDVPVPVDSGEVRVVLERDKAILTESTVHVGGAGEPQAELELEVPPRILTPPPSALLPIVEQDSRRRPIASVGRSGPEPRDDDGGLFGQWWFWTAVGVVTAGAVVMVVALGAEPEAADATAIRGDFEPGLLEGRVEAP